MITISGSRVILHLVNTEDTLSPLSLSLAAANTSMGYFRHFDVWQMLLGHCRAVDVFSVDIISVADECCPTRTLGVSLLKLEELLEFKLVPCRNYDNALISNSIN